jgi:phage terminase large subunit
MSTVIQSNYKPHAKQMILHMVPLSAEVINIIFFGGDRGGGKSAGILVDAFMFANKYPGAKCIIIRESVDAVKQSFLDKLPTLIPEDVDDGFKRHRLYTYKEKSHSYYPSRCILLPNGSYITLQPILNYQMAISKQGWEFHYLAVDEVTKHDEKTINYLFSTVRSAQLTDKKGNPYYIPTKIVLSGNPGGKGHKWVKEKYIDTTVVAKDPKTNRPTKTKEFVEYVKDPRDTSGKTKIKRVIQFIPASWQDNKYLHASYVANLMSLPETKRKMDMDGNWDVVAGKMFNVQEDNIIEPRIISDILRKQEKPFDIYISVDWGFNPSKHSAHWHIVTSDKQMLTFMELYGGDLVFEHFVEKIKEMSEGLVIEATALPHDMFRKGDLHRDREGKIIGETKADVFESLGLNPLSVSSGKGQVGLRNDKIHSALTMKDNGVKKFRISSACIMLLEELDNAVHDDFNPEHIDKSCADHAIDDYGLMLVLYSDDIAPIESQNDLPPSYDRVQKLLVEFEKQILDEPQEDMYVEVDDYDSLY